MNIEQVSNSQIMSDMMTPFSIVSLMLIALVTIILATGIAHMFLDDLSDALKIGSGISALVIVIIFICSLFFASSADQHIIKKDSKAKIVDADVSNDIKSFDKDLTIKIKDNKGKRYTIISESDSKAQKTYGRLDKNDEIRFKKDMTVRKDGDDTFHLYDKDLESYIWKMNK